jgi:hypothetical protein
MADATTGVGKAELLRRLRGLAGALAGRGPDPGGAVRAMLLALGVEAQTVLREAFLAKARGGADESGTAWAPLKPETVAYGRRHPGLARKKARAAKAGRGARPLLTAAQDELWRRTYRAKLKGSADPRAAANAAAWAWAVVKLAGGKTVLGVYGKAPVEVGRDTDRLFRSVGPGPPHPDRLLEVEPGAVTVGTNVPYAAAFHAKRPLWPAADGWPDVWWARLAAVAAQGVENAVRRLL